MNNSRSSHEPLGGCNPPLLSEHCGASSCPVCGSERAALFVTAEETRSVHRCRCCGFLFVLPRPTPDELDELYSDVYFPGHDMSAATLDFRKPVFRQCLNTLRQLFPERGRLLDVGCWTGDFVQAAAGAGWSAAGIELSAKAAQFAATRNLDVRCCTLSTSPFSSASFDVVTMLDVLEHVLHPLQDLERARSLLRVNGAIVVRVPNTVFHLAKTRICRRLGVTDHGLQTQYHLNHFTPRTLSLALRMAGFHVISLQVGAPELIAHAPWARPWAKRAYVRLASVVLALTRLHAENVTVAYARKRN